MRTAGTDTRGRRLRGLIVVLWRAGLRIQEALALVEGDLDHRRGALLVRRGKGGRRREVGMDTWGWDELRPWLERRVGLPVGPLFCVLNGRTRGRQWSSAAARADLRRTAVAPCVRRRFAPHQLRHAHAVEMAREDVPLVVIQRQLGHSNLGITSVYLQGGRQRRDHRHRSRSPRADDPSQHITSALIDTRALALLIAQSATRNGAGPTAASRRKGQRAQRLTPAGPTTRARKARSCLCVADRCSPAYAGVGCPTSGAMLPLFVEADVNSGGRRGSPGPPCWHHASDSALPGTRTMNRVAASSRGWSGFYSHLERRRGKPRRYGPSPATTIPDS
jgi:Phage integrase family